MTEFDTWPSTNYFAAHWLYSRPYIASHHVTLRAITVRHAYWNALIQVTILWLTIAFCWAGFLWLVNGPWVIVGAAIFAAMPIPLLIITVQFGLTRISDGVARAIDRESVPLD